MNSTKYVYTFGGKTAEGKADMKNLLGGKGANLAEMCLLGLPVPAGLTISTECCTAYYANNCQLPATLMDEVWKGMKNMENLMGLKYDDADHPLLVSCRSGARTSMPGMMDTVLNIGLSSKTIPGLIKKTGNPRFVYDSYRRLIMMYADVVMEKAEGIEPADGKGIRKQLDDMLDEYKEKKGYKSDTELKAEELLELAEAFKKRIKEVLGTEFPDDAKAQLRAASRPCSNPGTARRLSPTAVSRVFPMTGALQSTCSRWSSATWATAPQPALHSPVTPPPARTSSTANG